MKFNRFRGGIIPIAVFIYYLILTLLIQMGIGSGVGLLSSIRYILYLLFIIFSLKYFLFRFGIKVLEMLTLTISTYVIVQFIYFIALSKTLPWHVPFLNVIDQNFILIEKSEFYLTFYRPTGVFLEPTHYAQFCVVYLVYLLFYNLEKKPYLLKSLLVTFGIIASGSSLGFIFLCFICIVWVIKTQVRKLSPLKIIITLISIIGVISIIFSVDYLRYTVERMVTTEGFNGAAVGYRFDSLRVFVNGDLSLLDWLIGSGRSTNEVYFTGIFYFIYSNGIIGLILYLWICIDTAMRTRGFSRWIIISALFLSIGSEFMANFGILFYLTFAFNENKDNIMSSYLKKGNRLENNIIKDLKLKSSSKI